MNKEVKDNNEKSNDGNIIKTNDENMNINTEETTKNNDTKIKKFFSDKKNIKNAIIITVCSVICLAIGFYGGKETGRRLPATHKRYSDNKVIATVGNSKITGKQLKERMEPVFYLSGKKKMADEEVQAYEASMIDYMTTTEVLYLKGKEENVKATKEEVDKEYDNFTSSLKDKFSMGEDDFLKEFKFTKEHIRSQLEKEVIATKYLSKASEVTVSEAKKYYDNNKDKFMQISASHILIKTTDDQGKPLGEKEKAKKKVEAENILKKAKSGVDFAALAKEYSEDTSASKGGDLGFFGKGQMVESFENAAFNLKNGEISNKLVESEYGYHIIKKTGEKQENFDDIKNDLVYSLSYDKQGNIIDNLVEEYNVKINK